MNFAAISDVHMAHDDIVPQALKGIPIFDDVSLPPADVLLDAGDMTYTGKVGEVSRAAQFRGSLLRNKRYKHVVATAGNHDFLFQKQHYVAKKLMEENGIIYLEDDAVTLEGDKAIPGFHPGPGRITIYGSPWQPEFHNWAFNLPRNSEQLDLRWKLIPEGVDILITHGPQYGILDAVPRDGAVGWGSGEDFSFGRELVGCEVLARHMQRIKPRVHVFGHIHASYGRHEQDGLLSLNASIMNERYDPMNKPHTFTLEPREKLPDPAGEPEQTRE